MENSGTSPAKDPLIIAHRGASALAPENTLAAFRRALEDGADGVELDVRLSRDGMPIVIHDASLRRTGLCEGVVEEMTARELGEADVGSWFNRARPHLARPAYSRQRVPTLDQVLRFFHENESRPANRRSQIYVEMKTGVREASSVDLAQSVVQLINEHEFRDRVVVVSFDLVAIVQIKKIDSLIRTGALFEPKRAPIVLIRKQEMISAAIESGADEILLHRSIATQAAVRLARQNKLSVVVWTVDHPKWTRRASGLGIHALITNNPAAMSGQRSNKRAID